MRIINKTKGTILADNAIVADSLLSRMKGLLGRQNFIMGEALVIKPCNCVHSFFMHFPIDVLFIDSNNRIIGIKRYFNPWRVSPIYLNGKSVVELPCGVVAKSGTATGDEIMLL